MFFPTAVLLSLAALISAQDSDTQVVEAVLKNTSVIPDVLPATFTPRFPIEVVFPQAGTNQPNIPVTAGANLTMNETLNKPFFAIQSNNTMIIGKSYLIAIVDPDAPSPPNRNISQFLHFLGVNYVADKVTDNEVLILKNNSAAITDYVNPTPPNGSIPHRYVVALYLQNSTNVTAANGTVPADRMNFNLTRFVEETGNLTLLGATVFFVGPGNSTDNNTVTGNASLSSILSSPSATSAAELNIAFGSNGTGGAATLEFVVPAAWSTLALLFGFAAYMI